MTLTTDMDKAHRFSAATMNEMLDLLAIASSARTSSEGRCLEWNEEPMIFSAGDGEHAFMCFTDADPKSPLFIESL